MHWCARIFRNVTVLNGTFSLGVTKDIPLVGIDNVFNDRWWNTFNVTNETTSFPGNKTFSISPTDNSAIMVFLSNIFSSNINDPFGLALFNSTNLTETVALIGKSMTYALGQSPSGDQVNGQIISTEQYIQIHWLWIVLPLAEIVMGIAFLLCTLVHTWRKGVVAWKSSGIVPMFTAMDGWDSKELRATSWRDIQERSERMRGMLVTSREDVQTFRRTHA
jgi:hypothetical protein